MYFSYNESYPIFNHLRLSFGCDCDFQAPIGVTIFPWDPGEENDPHFNEYPYFADVRCFRCRGVVYDVKFDGYEYPNLKKQDLESLSDQILRQGCPHGWSGIFLTAPIHEHRNNHVDYNDGIKFYTHLAWCRSCRRTYKIKLPKNRIYQGVWHEI